eukprot:gene2903-4746_t
MNSQSSSSSQRRLNVIVNHLININGKSKRYSNNENNLNLYNLNNNFDKKKLKENLNLISKRDKSVLYYSGEIKLNKKDEKIKSYFQSKVVRFFTSKEKEIALILKDNSILSFNEFINENKFYFLIFDFEISNEFNFNKFKKNNELKNECNFYIGNCYLNKMKSNEFLFSYFLTNPVECFITFVLKDEKFLNDNLNGFYFLNDSKKDNLRKFLVDYFKNKLFKIELFRELNDTIFIDLFSYFFMFKLIFKDEYNYSFSKPNIDKLISDHHDDILIDLKEKFLKTKF